MRDLPTERPAARALIGALRRSVWRVPVRPRRVLLRSGAVRAIRAAFYDRLGERVVTVPDGGFSMQVDLAQFDHRAHFRTPHVERRVVELLSTAVRPGDRAVDIGAFCGYYTLLMARRVGPTGRVVAFEPLPEHADRVDRNVALNDLDNVVVERLAVADASGTRRFRAAGPSSSLMATADDALEVEAVTIDDYVAGGRLDRVDVVKIDVEGAEPEALAGMRATLLRDGPLVVVEVNDDGDRSRVEAFLASVGYECELLGREIHGAHLAARPRPGNR